MQSVHFPRRRRTVSEVAALGLVQRHVRQRSRLRLGGTGDWGAGDVLAPQMNSPYRSLFLLPLSPCPRSRLRIDLPDLHSAIAACGAHGPTQRCRTLVRRPQHGQRRMCSALLSPRTWGRHCARAAFVAAVGAVLAIWAPGTTSLAAALRHIARWLDETTRETMNDRFRIVAATTACGGDGRRAPLL
jgi:hypothetical protein